MRRIAFDIPDEVISVREGIERFVRRVVIPMHEKDRQLLSNQRHLYLPDGRICDEAPTVKKHPRSRYIRWRVERPGGRLIDALRREQDVLFPI